MRRHRNQVAQLFRILRNETRLTLLFLLAKGPATSKELCQATGRTRSTVSRQLRILANHGYVKVVGQTTPLTYNVTPSVSFLRKRGETYLSFQVQSGERVMIPVAAFVAK